MARNNDRQDRNAQRDEPEMLEKLVGINRVAKVVKGGRRFGFAFWLWLVTARAVRLRTGKAREVPGQSARQLRAQSATWFGCLCAWPHAAS